MIIFLLRPIPVSPFTAVDCMGLNNPANGMVALSGTTFTHTATYSCLSGFALIGQDTRQCLATRLWSGEEPTCVGECTRSNLLLHGQHK